MNYQERTTDGVNLINMFAIIAVFIIIASTSLMAGKYTITISGKKLLINEQEFKVKGLRCSNALVSDAATNQLIENLPLFKSYGINSVSVYFMGSRFGDVKGYTADSKLSTAHANRMGKIIEAADNQGMMILVGCLYWGTSKAKSGLNWNQTAANKAVANTVTWLKNNNYTNVIVDPDNEGMSPFNINKMIQAGHTAHASILIANNGRDKAPDADLNIHFGPKESGKPYFDSEGTVGTPMGGYWSTYSKESNKSTGYYNYSRIGRYTSSMREGQKSKFTNGVDSENGYMLASTWLQCGPGEGVNGPFMIPGGHSNIDDVNKDIDDIHPDAGVLWLLDHIKSTHGAWVPPSVTTSVLRTTKSSATENEIIEINGLVSFEAEHTTRNKNWIPLSMGSNDTTMMDNGSGSMEYDITFSKTGTYIVWVRHLKHALNDGSCASDQCNDCFAKMDGKDLIIYEGSSCSRGHVIGLGTHAKSLTWQSRPKTECAGDRNGKHVAFTIANAGMHTFKIGSRSKKYAIDKFVFMHSDLEITRPSGTGPEETMGTAGGTISTGGLRRLFIEKEYSNTALYDVSGRLIRFDDNASGLSGNKQTGRQVYIRKLPNGQMKKRIQIK